MLTGDDIKRARQMAGLSQGDLGKLVGVSMRSIGNYERGETVPRSALPKLQEVLGSYLGGHGPSLESASDAELLGEIAKRFARPEGSRHEHSAPTKAPDGADNVKKMTPGGGRKLATERRQAARREDQ